MSKDIDTFRNPYHGPKNAYECVERGGHDHVSSRVALAAGHGRCDEGRDPRARHKKADTSAIREGNATVSEQFISGKDVPPASRGRGAKRRKTRAARKQSPAPAVL